MNITYYELIPNDDNNDDDSIRKLLEKLHICSDRLDSYNIISQVLKDNEFFDHLCVIDFIDDSNLAIVVIDDDKDKLESLDKYFIPEFYSSGLSKDYLCKFMTESIYKATHGNTPMDTVIIDGVVDSNFDEEDEDDDEDDDY